MKLFRKRGNWQIRTEDRVLRIRANNKNPIRSRNREAGIIQGVPSSLDAHPRFRPRFLYLRTIHMRDRQATKCCLQAFRKSPSHCWVQFYLYRRSAQDRSSEQKKCSKPHFLESVQWVVSGSERRPLFRLVLWWHRSTVHGRMDSGAAT